MIQPLGYKKPSGPTRSTGRNQKVLGVVLIVLYCLVYAFSLLTMTPLSVATEEDRLAQTNHHVKLKQMMKEQNMAERDYPGYPTHDPSVIGSIQIVNLAFRASKWNAVRERCMASLLLRQYQIQRHIAVFGKDVDIIEYFEENKIGKNAYRSLISPRRVGGHYMTVGGMGCLLSHVSIWKKCIDLNRPVIAFEDDISLGHDFDLRFLKVLNDLPSDFGLLYFADLVKSEKSKASELDFNPGSSIYQLINGEHWGTYAYMISPSAARILYDKVYPLQYQVDSYMIDTCIEYNISVYRVKENLVTTDNSAGRISDVQVAISSKRHRIVPTVFHILDLPPLSFSLNKLIQRVDAAANRNNGFIKMDLWDRKRILQFGSEIGHVDLTHPLYSIQLLRLKLAILDAFGGIFLRQEFKPRHALGKVMHEVHGFIGFERINEMEFQYPILGLVPGDPKTTDIISCLSRVLAQPGGINATALKLEAHGCLLSRSDRFPIPGGLLLFPANVLAETGYN